jgi:acetyl esterase/lipase
MKHFTKNLTNENSTLTGYIHNYSNEMPTITKRPAVLVIPGGGYFMCSDREAEPVALAYMAEGYNVFVLRYSVGPEKPCSMAFDDANEAMQYLHDNDQELCIDKTKIAVVGFSAGGHLAAWISIIGKVKPNAAVLGYPCTIAEVGKLLGKELPELFENIDEATPPTFIFTARDDKVVPVEHTTKYVEALTKANVAFEAHIFSGGGHGFSLAKPLTASGNKNMVNTGAAKWFPLSVEWLKELFGDFEVGDIKGFDGKIDTNTPIKIVRSNEGIYNKFREFFPALESMIEGAKESGHEESVMEASLRGLARFKPELFDVEQLDALDAALGG